MALKPKYAKKEEVPAAVAAFYVERDGAWLLDLEGGDRSAELDASTALVERLRKDLADVNARFAGVDPEQARKMAEEQRKREEEDLLKSGDTSKYLESRVRATRAEFEAKLQAKAAEAEALTARLSSIQIDQAVVTEATRRGLRGTAIPDITARARNNFRLVGGVPQAFEADGRTVRVGKDGVTPLSLGEWVDGQVAEAPHLFESNAGGGSVGNGSGGAGNRSGVNPWKKETRNITEQMRLEKQDPQLAARLAAAA